MAAPEIIVVGAGVAGLSCASELARAGRRVAVWTAAPPEQTTSMVAAAFWHPYRAGPIEQVGPWAVVSYERFASLAADLTLGPRAGVFMRDAIELYPQPQPDPPWARHVDMFRHAVPEELPPGYGHGIVFEAPVIDMSRYLPWMVAQLRRLGVEIVIRRLDSLAPALADADAKVVVNCTGLGARELVGDSSLYPVRGQVVRCTRDGLEQVVLDEHDEQGISYIIPRGEDVVLGGVAEDYDEDLRERPEQTAAILKRCTRLVPALANTTVLGARVGLRPCRDRVRLEAEELACEAGDRLIVHNYGHGGAGVTLSWGCAEEVRERVSAWLTARR
ncbi:MAG: FAD-dependent oxidoreductase [Enhygromyxa sp.]